MKAVLWFDGSNDPKQRRPASWGFVLEIEGRDPIEDQGLCKPGFRDIVFPQTNNTAEYSALCNGLRRALTEGVSDLTVYGDSELVVYQITEKYKLNGTKYPHLKVLNTAAKGMMRQFDRFTILVTDGMTNKADGVSRVVGKTDTIQRSTKTATGKVTRL